MTPTRPVKTILPALLAFPVATAALASEARAADFDFSTSSQYSDNFQRTFLTSGSSNAFSFANNRLEHTSTGSGTAVIAYDTTPDGTPSNFFTNVTVGFDFSSSVANTSFGIYFGGDSRTASSLAIFNLNTNATINGAGSNETIRFFTGGNLTTGGAGSLLGSATALTNGGFTSAGATYHASLTISYVTATTANVTLTVSDPLDNIPSFSASALNVTVASAGGEIGFRTGFLGGGGTNTLDNISISTVPEPASFALLGGLGALGLAAIRRRRR